MRGEIGVDSFVVSRVAKSRIRFDVSSLLKIEARGVGGFVTSVGRKRTSSPDAGLMYFTGIVPSLKDTYPQKNSDDQVGIPRIRGFLARSFRYFILCYC